MFKRLREDIEVVFEQDPAARSYFEVILTYSGLHAVWAHRIAHAFIKRISSLLHVGSHKLVVSLLALRFIQEQQLVVVFSLTMEWGCNWRNVRNW